jgi:glutathione S-transferase
VSLLLYDNPASANALKVRFAMEELRLRYEREEVPLSRPRPAWYLEFQPSGRVPALRDGDVLLAESNAILRYLATREGRDDLYPTRLADRARVDWALDLWSTVVRPALFALEQPLLMTDPPDTERAAAAAPAAEDALDVYERFAHGEGTVLGSFTIADICVAPVLWRSKRLPLDFGRRPRLAAIRAAVDRNPAFAAAGPVR